MADNEIINNESLTSTVVEVAPFTASFTIKIDDWEKCGTIYEAHIEVPGLAKDGITKAFPDEEKIKENGNISYATKVISDILSGDYLELKTEDNMVIASYIDNNKPKADIYMEVEQLPFF